MLSEHKELLKNKSFVTIWVSQILSQLTVNTINFLLLTRIFAATQSTIATSFLWISYALPAILVGPFAAAYSDMADKRRILMLSVLLQMFTIFLFAVYHPAKIYLFYAVVFTYSLFNQFYIPAEAATIPTLVTAKDLPAANGLFFLTQQTAIVLGYGFSGLISRFLGFSGILFMCAGLLLTAAVVLSFLPKLKVRAEFKIVFEDALATFFGRIAEGYSFIKGNRLVIIPFALLTGLQVATAILVVNIPQVALDIFKIDIEDMGILIVVPGAIGALLGAVFVPKIVAFKRKRKVIEISLVALGVSILMMLSLGFVNGLVKNIASILVIVASGIFFVGILIPAQTLLQEKTPEELRGRVFGNFWFVVTILTVIPVLLSATITEVLGIRVLFLIMGLLPILGVFLVNYLKVKIV